MYGMIFYLFNWEVKAELVLNRTQLYVILIYHTIKFCVISNGIIFIIVMVIDFKHLLR